MSYKEIRVALGVVDGGIGINWGYLGLPPEIWRLFINDLFRAAGFGSPSNVRWERNHPDSPHHADWNRLRISAAECVLQGVRPGVAVRAIANWLESKQVLDEYQIRFLVESVSSAV